MNYRTISIEQITVASSEGGRPYIACTLCAEFRVFTYFQNVVRRCYSQPHRPERQKTLLVSR